MVLGNNHRNRKQKQLHKKPKHHPSIRFLPFHIVNDLIVLASRVAQVVTPEMLLQQVLVGIRDGSYSEKMKAIPIERLINHVRDYYQKYKNDPNDSENLKFAKAFTDLIYLLEPDYKDDRFDLLFDAVTHAWLAFIPRTIKALTPIRAIPGEVIKRLSIPMATTTDTSDQLPELIAAEKPMAKPVEQDFSVEDLKRAKYTYRVAELCFVMRDFETAEQYLFDVLKTQYLNVDSNNLMVQNSILWSEDLMQNDKFEKSLEILNKVNLVDKDEGIIDLVTDKIKEATVLHKIRILEEKCPLNEHSVGIFLRERIGYKNFLRLTYFIFGNVEFHQRLEEIRVFPKKMIYPLLKRDPTPENEELIVQRHEMHDELIRGLYNWYWSLEIVNHYLSEEIKEDLTNKFGEFGSGPVIYFRYISKGQYANIIISKAVELVGQDDIQEAKKVLYETFEFTGSKKIKGYLDFLRQHDKAKKSSKYKITKKRKKPKKSQKSKKRAKVVKVK